jgi:hypothetical protein
LKKTHTFPKRQSLKFDQIIADKQNEIGTSAATTSMTTTEPQLDEATFIGSKKKFALQHTQPKENKFLLLFVSMFVFRSLYFL